MGESGRFGPGSPHPHDSYPAIHLESLPENEVEENGGDGTPSSSSSASSYSLDSFDDEEDMDEQ